ncbi:hypothetical protein ACE38V_19020 [Cytobacillus sp. Hz8]|uniref:hypothetical protein n=1 Tax=Cytobacillus sp. Hz8 TaxID=3347168 RepID=UPI0035D681A6
MFINKEQKEKIVLLNKVLGTRYLTTPYNLLNPKDLIEAATFITSEYVDMEYYWRSLSDINSRFDESLEVFYPAKWMNLSLKNSTNDEEIDDAIDALNSAEEAMSILMDKAEEKCKWVWELILFLNFSEVKKYFFGENVQFDDQKVNDVLEENLSEIYDGSNYKYTVEDSAKEFAKHLLNRCK